MLAHRHLDLFLAGVAAPDREEPSGRALSRREIVGSRDPH